MSVENNETQLDGGSEAFCGPGHTDLKSLTDGRRPGEFKSTYDCLCWCQIIFELVYLLAILFGALFLLLLLAKLVILGKPNVFFPELLGDYPSNKYIIVWISVTLGGICGGCTASLKWLYHTVAKQRWHHDRLIWRLVVPILAAILAGFTGLLIHAGLVPNDKMAGHETMLSNPGTAAAFGFFIGLFSDHVLASLQNLAFRIFGTIDEKS